MVTVPKRPTKRELVEDPKFVGAVFADLDNAFRDCDYEPTLRQVLPELAQDHAGFFGQARDSGGSPWPPLSPVTVAAKGHSTILVDSGALRASLTQPGGPNNVAAASHRGLIFGTADHKAGYHQTGTSKMPARPPVGLTEQRLDSICEAVADTVIEALKL